MVAKEKIRDHVPYNGDRWISGEDQQEDQEENE
jgi:hypothetical protein